MLRINIKEIRIKNRVLLKAAVSNFHRVNISVKSGKLVCIKYKKPGHVTNSCYKGIMCIICGKEYLATVW